MLWIYDEVILSYFILYKDLFCGVWIKYFVFVRSIFYFLNGLWCLLGLEKYMYVVFYIIWDVFIMFIYSSKLLWLFGIDYGYIILILNDIK